MLDKIATKIIKEQELIMGPIAWEEARQVEGLKVDVATRAISFTVTTNQEEVIDRLVRRYERFFGRASVEVCRDAVKDLIVDTPENQIPSLLR